MTKHFCLRPVSFSSFFFLFLYRWWNLSIYDTNEYKIWNSVDKKMVLNHFTLNICIYFLNPRVRGGTAYVCADEFIVCCATKNLIMCNLCLYFVCLSILRIFKIQMKLFTWKKASSMLCIRLKRGMFDFWNGNLVVANDKCFNSFLNVQTETGDIYWHSFPSHRMNIGVGKKYMQDHSIAVVNKTRQSINKSADGFQTNKQANNSWKEREQANERMNEKRGKIWIIKNKMRNCGKKEKNILPFSSLFVLLISSSYSLNHSVCSIYSPFSNFSLYGIWKKKK